MKQYMKYIMILLTCLIVSGCSKKEEYSKNMFYMDTYINVKIFTNNGKKAKEALLDLLEKNPNSYKAHRLLAEIYEKEGGMRKAIDEYVQAIDLNKQDFDSYYKVAKLLNGLDKKEEATQMLFNLLDKKPENYEASILLRRYINRFRDV